MMNLNFQQYEESFNNKNRHEEFENEHFAEKIAENAKCNDNEILITNFAQMYVWNALKNVPFVYQYFFYQPMMDSIKTAMSGIFSVEKISEMEKSIDYEAKYKECKENYEKFESNMQDCFGFLMMAMQNSK